MLSRNVSLTHHVSALLFLSPLSTGEPKGKMEKIGPYDTYVATPSNPSKDTALVFNCDAFGLDLQNNKIIPDRLAEALNVTVYVPDYFLGNPMPESFMDGQPTSVTEKSKQGFLSKIGTIGKMATAAPCEYSDTTRKSSD